MELVLNGYVGIHTLEFRSLIPVSEQQELLEPVSLVQEDLDLRLVQAFQVWGNYPRYIWLSDLQNLLPLTETVDRSSSHGLPQLTAEEVHLIGVVREDSRTAFILQHWAAVEVDNKWDSSEIEGQNGFMLPWELTTKSLGLTSITEQRFVFASFYDWCP